MDTRLIDYVLGYARQRWWVFPVHSPVNGGCSCGKEGCRNTGKHPRTRYGLKDATTDEITIEQWWGKWPDANIGLLTGKKSGLLVLDIDPRHGGDESLQELESKYGKLPETVRVKTGGGGQHIYFRLPLGCKLKNAANLAGFMGIDVRCEGGYVVAPPSRHVSGGTYEWIRDPAGDAASVPEWLVTLLQKREKGSVGKFDTATALAGVPEGMRDEQLFKLAGKLRRADVPHDQATKLVLEAAAKCSPPFPPEEAIKKVVSAYRRYPPGVPEAPESPTIAFILEESGLNALTGDSTLDNVLNALIAMAKGICRREPLFQEAARQAVVKRLAEINVSAPVKMFNSAMEQVNSSFQESKFEEPEPWPDEVDGDALLDELVLTLRRFVILPDGAAEMIALWVIHTYSADATSTFPILIVTSPRERCGKTLLVMDVLGALVNKPYPASNLSAPVLFRAIAKYEPTLLIDEADTFLNEKDELRGILNAGHRRGGQVSRCVGEAHEIVEFMVWGPKAIATIGKLQRTLQDRGIVVHMKRKSKREKVDRWRWDRHSKELLRYCRQAIRWVADHKEELKECDPQIPEALGDRAQDNWRPLIAIASIVGGGWPERAYQSALTLSREVDEIDEEISGMLLSDLYDLFEAKEATELPSHEIVTWLVELEHQPWSDWKFGKPISPSQVAGLLKGYGIRPIQIWKCDKEKKSKNLRGYRKDQFADAFERYLPKKESTEPSEAVQSSLTN